MALTDMFKAKQFKNDIEKLSSENEYLKSLLTPEMQNVLNIKKLIGELQEQKQAILEDIFNEQKKYQDLNTQITALNQRIEEKKKYVVFLDDEILYQDFALYTPVYDLMNSESYKNKLLVVRERQKSMIKNNTAAHFPTNFTYNNSVAQGKKLVADNVKQILRAFNNECDSIIDKVKFNNVEAIRKRIIKSYDDLNKLNSKMMISIDSSYLDLKLQEMNLCYEYSMKKQEEKEEARRIREEQREAQKLQKEIEEARKTSEKEKKHYLNALTKINAQLENATDLEKELLLEKKNEIEHQLGIIEEEIKQIDYREANQRAGYVYVISNIGSFGENVFKIGMTRRLEPMDRVDELGDASVPFKFDVHAMIFSDDAPKLEAALHRAFDDKKVNMINTRREFFHVSLDEIERVVKENYDKTVEFVKTPAADQFRESQMLRKHKGIPETIHPEPQDINLSENRETAPSSVSATELDPNKEYVQTKWGYYEKSNPYIVDLTRGPRNT